MSFTHCVAGVVAGGAGAGAGAAGAAGTWFDARNCRDKLTGSQPGSKATYIITYTLPYDVTSYIDRYDPLKQHRYHAKMPVICF